MHAFHMTSFPNFAAYESTNERNTLERRKLKNTLEQHTQKALAYKNTYTFQKTFLSKNSNSPTDYLNLINDIEKLVKNSERKSDMSRNQKLAKLISEKTPYYTKSKFINLTDVQVPAEIEALLELGPNNLIGGYVRNEGSESFLS